MYGLLSGFLLPQCARVWVDVCHILTVNQQAFGLLAVFHWFVHLCTDLQQQQQCPLWMYLGAQMQGVALTACRFVLLLMLMMLMMLTCPRYAEGFKPNFQDHLKPVLATVGKVGLVWLKNGQQTLTAAHVCSRQAHNKV